MGLVSSSSSQTQDGFGTLFQTNYLGHWLLTRLLLARIKRTADKRWKADGNKYGAPVRIISVSSGGHSDAAIPYQNDNEWREFIEGGCGYGQSKLLQIMRMRQLQKELAGYADKIQCVSITPGLVWTNMVPNYLAAIYPVFCVACSHE